MKIIAKLLMSNPVDFNREKKCLGMLVIPKDFFSRLKSSELDISNLANVSR